MRLNLGISKKAKSSIAREEGGAEVKEGGEEVEGGEGGGEVVEGGQEGVEGIEDNGVLPCAAGASFAWGAEADGEKERGKTQRVLPCAAGASFASGVDGHTKNLDDIAVFHLPDPPEFQHVMECSAGETKANRLS
eukprot:TRINITY_DN1312_c0_g1_i2.p3 TRINITY_DN1312_c0_g1~~TRINITY_DN1312_c0_g1_i2.p3  ORF type:complete len:135 (+),score=25.70 TRINITY_DN1312_c0_g1_i2:494-898(+)